VSETPPNGGDGNGQPQAGDGKGDGTADVDINNASNIDELLKASAELARQSFEDQIKLGQKALRRLADPKSEEGSVADDVQVALSYMARDAMLVLNTWNRLISLSAKKSS
jgi:hypothetical protein